MEYSKIQIDARVALRQKAPRNRRILPATDALCYRYESRQFFTLDIEIFVDLFAGLSRQQLSRVARAPEVITKDEQHAATFDDFWPLLYQQGRKEKPRWAALCLVEAAQHVLSQTLQAESNPPTDVINQFADNVKWLKNTLCASDVDVGTRTLKPADQIFEDNVIDRNSADFQVAHDSGRRKDVVRLLRD
ncbi:High-osmolarity-induced transcription protein 1 [Purpureocillium lavendulum]|uniref:High-osmolarity-induced transcription protein 1 n=1 Tax=Purpureocillium lavendulum TaxID=1247861 RepID=A0AB34FF44_9HYPO|nr:High-osmolarity-induced transcription protein 1 [Purpureocillium lavendulum]